MPVLTQSVQNIITNIINPVVEEVSNRILQFLEIKDIIGNNIYFNNINQAGSNMYKQEHKPKISTDNRCDIEIIPEFNPNNTKYEMNISRFGNTFSHTLYGFYPIFEDDEANVKLFEYCIPCSVQLSFNIRFNDYNLTNSTSLKLYNKVSSDPFTVYTDVLYSYPLPDIIILALYDIYNKKNIQPINGKEVTFQIYLLAGSENSIQLAINKEKPDNKELVVMKGQNFITTEIEFSEMKSDTEKVNKYPSTNTLNFNCYIQFALPNLLKLDFPVIVNGQYLDDKIIKFIDLYPHNFNVKTRAQDVAINELYLEAYNRVEELSFLPFMRYPKEDDWIIEFAKGKPSYLSKSKPFFVGIGAPELNPNTNNYEIKFNIEQDIFSLYPDDIKNSSYLTKLIEILKISDEVDVKLFKSPIHIAIFDNDYIADIEHISYDPETTTITYTHDQLDRSHIFRLFLGYNLDIEYIEKKYIHEMLGRIEVFKELILMNLHFLEENGYIKIRSIKENFYKSTNYIFLKHVGGYFPSPIKYKNYIFRPVRGE